MRSHVMFLSRWSKLRSRTRTHRTYRPEFLPLETRIVPTVSIHVDNVLDANGPSPFPGYPAGQLSLRRAIDLVNSDVSDSDYVIHLQKGASYQLAIAGAGEDENKTGDLDLKPASGVTVTIIADDGVGAGNATIDALGIDRVLHVIPQGFLQLTLTNINITGGAVSSGHGSTGDGGGILFDDGNLGP